MSNSTIISRLENKLENFISNKISNDNFAKFLVDSVESLEGISYQTIKEARDFQYKFEVANFVDDDPEIEPIEVVIEHFKEWLKVLKQE